jgi:hypothetical protein
MRRALLALAVNAALAAPVLAQPADPDPDMNNPDKSAWELFAVVNKPANATHLVFETWASNEDTFKTNPIFPGAQKPPQCGTQTVAAVTSAPAVASPKILNVPALEALAPSTPGLQPHVVPGGTENAPSEEVRRNESTFNFIVCNKFHTKAGLRAAFAAGQPISFPIDSIEVKANWKPVGNRSPSEYYIATASDNKRYALVSMHIISKKVPNWTWATFEQKDNPGRCDYIGCHDHFGAVVADVAPHTALQGRYDPCVKTPALKKLFADAGLPALWENYCLKGTQLDFVSATGVRTLLGNSVTEAIAQTAQGSFVPTSSCMSCHSRAAVNAQGTDPLGGGFINSSNPSVCPPTQFACSPNGPPDPTLYWTNPGQPNQTMLLLQTDFVYSIALRAIGQ